jgi:hypothetical protein
MKWPKPRVGNDGSRECRESGTPRVRNVGSRECPESGMPRVGNAGSREPRAKNGSHKSKISAKGRENHGTLKGNPR